MIDSKSDLAMPIALTHLLLGIFAPGAWCIVARISPVVSLGTSVSIAGILAERVAVAMNCAGAIIVVELTIANVVDSIVMAVRRAPSLANSEYLASMHRIDVNLIIRGVLSKLSLHPTTEAQSGLFACGLQVSK